MEELIGLYIHIPFCLKKCNYCDFASYSGMENIQEQYIEAVSAEMRKHKGIKLDSVFMGGGTPTALNSALIKRILDEINKNFILSEDCEFTCEANPGTIDEEKLLVLKNGGVNRLSIGVQSFNDKELEALGRVHNSRIAIESIKLAKKYFHNINIDIMTNIPFQTKESLKNTLDIALGLETEHISCYSLIIEEGTLFHKMYEEGKLSLWDDEEDRLIFKEVCEILKKKGYERYEISNFAKPQKRSRHNLKYWNTNEYIGIGAAAHSCYNNKRFSNSEDIYEYINNPIEPKEVMELSVDDRIGEYIIMSLRTADGVDTKEFKMCFNKDFDVVYGSLIAKYTKLKMLRKTCTGYALTEEGMDVSNRIMCEFV